MTGLWQIVVRSLWARRWRTVFSALAVALGIAVVLGVQTAMSGLDAQAQSAQIDRAGRSGLDLRIASGNGLETGQLQRIKAIPGVVTVVPLYEKRVVSRADNNDLDGITVTLVSVDASGTSALRPVALSLGRLPDPDSHSEIAVDVALADALGKRAHTTVGIGSTIQLTTNTGPDTYTVVGLTSGTSGGAAFTRTAVFASESTMTSTFSLGLHAPLVALELATGVDPNRVATDVHAALGSAVTIVDPRSGGGAPLDQLRPLLLLLVALSVFVGAGVTANSVSLSALERRREVALLRAGGASGAQVSRVFMAEGILTAALGVPFGLLAGIGLGILMTIAFTSVDVPAHIDAATALTAIGIGLGSGIIGAAVPAVIAGRAPILDGLRPHAVDRRDRLPLRILLIVPVALALAMVCFLDATSTSVAIGGALVLVAVTGALPALTGPLITVVGFFGRIFSRETRVATANLRRHRNRTALTIAGLAVSVATAIGSAALAGGATNASDAWIHQMFVGNAIVKSPVTQSDAIATAIGATSGVRSVATLRLLSASVSGDVLGIAVVDPSAYADAGRLDITTPNRDQALRTLRDNAAVFVPQSIADATGWQVGTVLQIEADNRAVDVRVVGIVSHSFPSGDGRESLMMARGVATTLFGSTASGFDDLMVTTADSNLDPLRTAAASYGLSAVSVADIQDSARRSLTHSIGLLSAIASIAVLIAMLAVGNTLAVNVRQGTRELALLRAVGLSRIRALRLVLVEAALMGAAGTLVGLIAGGLLAFPMIAASSTAGFSPVYIYPGATAAFIVAAVVIATVVAATLPARRAVTASIVGAIRYE